MQRGWAPAALGPALLASVTVGAPAEPIADPRPKSAVVDTTGTLGVADTGLIDSLAARARAEGELVVVVIPSVGGVAPRQFATQLFNRWRIDATPRNRGVMLLAALRDRRVEIVVGDGYTKSATEVTDRIVREVLVPQFKAGRPRDAVVEGARAIVDRLVLGQVRSPASAGARPPAAPPRPLAATPRPPRPEPAPQGLLDRATSALSEHPLPVTGGLGGAALGAVALVRRHLRRRPRTCSTCATTMVRLDEAADDAHLTGGEKAEESVGSVDYDVWGCPGCSHTLKLRYGALFTSYARCPGCDAKTLSSSTTTVVAATTSSTGEARVDEQCAHCSHTRSYTRTIPRVSQSSSSSGSSRSGGSSSGRGSSGSW